MTIPTTDRIAVYTGNGSTTVFPFSFNIPDTDSTSVLIEEIATETQVELSYPSDYSITGLNDNAGGEVTYNPGTPLPATHRILIIRETVQVQNTSVSNQTAYFAGVVEAVWDRLTMMVQDLQEQVNRGFTAQPGNTVGYVSSGDEGTVPIWDADKNLVAGPTASEISSAQSAALAAAQSEENAALSAAEAATFDPALYLAKADNLSGLADTGTAQTNLGFSAYIKTLIGAVDAAAARLILGVGTNGTLSQTALQLLQSVWNAGTSTTEAYISPAKLAAAIAAQVTGVEKFTSSAFTATAAGLVAVNHGMSGPPRFIAFRGKCLVADAGYAVDDEILLSINQSNSSQAKDNTPVITDTQIIVKLTNNSTAFSASNKTTGVTNGLTNTSWEYYIEAIR